MPDTASAYKLFHDGILTLAEMEDVGMRIDVDYIHAECDRIDRRIAKLERIIYDSKFFEDWQASVGGKKINMYSGQQLGAYLYDVLGLKVNKTTKAGKGSTDDESLSEMGIYELHVLLDIKSLKLMKKTYLIGLEREAVDGVIHPFFNLHLVRTYRGSANNPNIQNVPKRDEKAMKMVRRAIYPREGNQLLEMDYSQLEVRIAACYHADPNMVKYIETGHDMHGDVCVQIFKLDKLDKKVHKMLRSATKNGFVFPQFYGDYYKHCAEYLCKQWVKLPTKGRWRPGQGIMVGDEHLSDHMIRKGIKSFNDFVDHLKAIEDDFWDNRFPVYKKWREDWWKEYQKNGFFVGKTGFRYSGLMKRNDAINYPVQGAAFHVLLLALILGNRALKEEGLESRIVGQIHDAIVIDVVPKELKRVTAIMKCIMENDVRQYWKWINVPLNVEAELCPVDGSWAEKEEYAI